MTKKPDSEFIWTPESGARFAQLLEAAYTDGYYQAMVSEFGAPDPYESHDDFLSWQKHAVTSFFLWSIAHAKTVEIIREEKLVPSDEGKLFELGFKIDGTIYNVINDLAIQCKEAINNRLAENTPVPPKKLSISNALSSKFDIALQRMFNEVAEGKRDPNEIITVIMRTAVDHTPANMTIRSGEGKEIKTAEETLENIQKLESDPKVRVVGSPRKLNLL